MNLVKFNCNNCNAQLEIDLDHLQAYCPYCGQKLMIDFHQLGRVLSEKEKTKRSINREEEKTKRIQLEHEYQERKEIRENSKNENKYKYLFLLLIISVLLLLGEELYEKGSHKLKNEVQIPFSSNEIIGENYKEVIKRFNALGLKNIELAEKEDLIIAFFSDDGDVEKVTIAGDSSFADGDWFPVDSEIVITYHTFKDRSD